MNPPHLGPSPFPGAAEASFLAPAAPMPLPVDANQDALLRALDGLGRVIFEDDEADFPKFSFEGHPWPLHHWQLGLAMRGTAGLLRLMLEPQGLTDAFLPALPAPTPVAALPDPRADVLRHVWG